MVIEHHPSRDDSVRPDAVEPRVALYTSGHAPLSIDRQEATLRSFMAAHEPQWRVAAVYRDVANSRGWRSTRPGLRALRDAAASGEFDLLLIEQLDRLSRHAGLLHRIVKELSGSGVVIRTVTDHFDSSTPACRLVLGLWTAAAEYSQHADAAPRMVLRLFASNRGTQVSGQWREDS